MLAGSIFENSIDRICGEHYLAQTHFNFLFCATFFFVASSVNWYIIIPYDLRHLSEW
jgi:hypothetical protein